jgi:hypothetical protein
MRRANKQNILASTWCIDTKRGRIPVQRSRYLPETYWKDKENAHYYSERYHYPIPMFFHRQVSERFE